jgi:hypothetical protein
MYTVGLRDGHPDTPVNIVITVQIPCKRPSSQRDTHQVLRVRTCPACENRLHHAQISKHHYWDFQGFEGHQRHVGPEEVDLDEHRREVGLAARRTVNYDARRRQRAQRHYRSLRGLSPPPPGARA